MSYYLKSGNTFRVTSKEQMDLHETLPAANYVVKHNPVQGFYLESIEPFILPKKMYGDVYKNTTRIFTSFHDRSSTTGVLLCGEKGSGKSLLAKNISVTAAREGIPTLIIDAPFYGAEFNAFIQKIAQPCVILLDEYEKVYDNEQQLQLLTLLDGIYPSKKLFILTVNDKWRVDSHMRNRPGRIFYLINYDGLTEQFIHEYCNDTLLNKKETNKIIQISSTFDKFNFDMLHALVEEMNRFNEPAVEAIKILNVKPEFCGVSVYNVDLFVNEKKIDEKMLDNKKYKGNPLTSEFTIQYRIIEKDGDQEYEDHRYTQFTPDDIKSVEGNRYVLSVKGPNGEETAVLTRLITPSYNYLDHF